MSYYDAKVVAREDGSFEIVGVDIAGMREAGMTVALTVLAVEVRPQVLHLMMARGEDVGTQKVDQRCYELVGVSDSAWRRVKAVWVRDPSLLPRLASGEITASDANRMVGLHAGRPLIGNENHRASQKLSRTDAFPEATQPLLLYLGGWERRGFEFRHVNPREATKRVKTIDRLIDGLTKARADLALRSHRATMKVEG